MRGWMRRGVVRIGAVLGDSSVNVDLSAGTNFRRKTLYAHSLKRSLHIRRIFLIFSPTKGVEQLECVWVGLNRCEGGQVTIESST